MKTILVAGDLIWDNDLVQKQTAPTQHYEVAGATELHRRAGGAWYLKDSLNWTFEGRQDIDIRLVGNAKDSATAGAYEVSQAYQIWSLHAKTSETKEKVWRIDKFLGCQAHASKFAPTPNDMPDPDLLVLDNLCLGFFGEDYKKLKALQEGGTPQNILLKASSLQLCTAAFNDLVKRYGDCLTLIISAETLRERGAAISKGLSWDLTIEETVREFNRGRSSLDLAQCRCVIVSFGNEGVAAFCRKDKQPMKMAHFLYHPKEHEGAFKAKRPGITYGLSSLLTVAMARCVLFPEQHPLFQSLGRGMAAARAAHEIGAGEGKINFTAANNMIKEIFNPTTWPKKDAIDLSVHKAIETGYESSGVKMDETEKKALAKKFEKLMYPDKPKGETTFSSAFLHDLLSFPPDYADARFDLLRDVAGMELEYMAAKAVEIVVFGVDKALKNVPMACYQKYCTADREEIERINSIHNLIKLYKENKDDKKPLSIAVFGAPGSGKSFAIKQLSEELFGATKSILEFNLSQFTSRDELHIAFHQVRDATVRGQIPIVFWDEFDSDNLKWLKEFLAPMQDAEFRSGSISHPLGKAIFIFAGGTCESFEVFNHAAETAAQKEATHVDSVNKEKTSSFKSLKGPDFVSRLRGYVNIKGPNPVAPFSEADVQPHYSPPELAKLDPAYLIRRAILLRMVLERSTTIIDSSTRIASISAGVVNGFLHVEKFLFGARSLENVVGISNLVGAKSFSIANLPAPDLLHLHTSKEFLKLVHQGDVENSLIEAIAEACHTGWMAMKKQEGYVYGEKRNDTSTPKTHPLLLPYAELKEGNKDGNRLTARLTPAKLHEIGYCIKKKHEIEDQTIVKQFSTDKLKKLVDLEHDIWLRDKLINGYAFAEETNDELFLHRCIQHFNFLSEADMKLDYAIVNAIIPVLDKHGYAVVDETGK